MNFLKTKLLGLAALVLLATGCAGMGAQPVTKLSSARHCAAKYQLSDADGLRIGAEKPVSRPLSEDSLCVTSDKGVASVYAPFRLPEYSSPYRVTVESQTAGQALFAPEVMMLDAKGRVLRTIPYDRFSQRGDILQATVFVNAENDAERYLVVGSATSKVGVKDSRYVSGMMVIPVLAAGVPMFGMQGTETTQTRTLSYNGLVELRAVTAGPSRSRRAGTAHDVAREDFCCAL